MAGLIPPQKLEEIRAASDIVDVIGGYLGPLKRAGGNFVTLCPFHREKSPSFNVNPGRQIFHCFGCHKGGDVFTFVKDYENLSFIEAVRRLAERARIVLEFEDNPHAQQQRGEKEQLLHLHEEICKRWQTALANDAAGQIARDYLARRGVSADAVKLFRLGYAPDLWDDTVNWAKSKNFDFALVERGGLIIRKEGGDHFYDRFRGRLMFPICDEQGRVIGFSGRVLAGDEKTAKYVNSPETPIFTKGRVIFGLDKSKRAIADADCAIICEGQLDLIACFMADVKNVVAPQGTALTADHCRILKRYADEVVLCFDSDNAGQNAAVRSLDILLASGLAIRVATVPAPDDPDSFIKAHGGPAFAQLIANAEGFFDYYLNRLCVTHDIATDKGRTAVLKAMAEATQKTGDAVTVDKYAQKTAARLGVAPESMRAEFKKIAAAKPKFVLRPDVTPAPRAGGLQPPSAASSSPKTGSADPDSPPDDYYDSQPVVQPIEGQPSDTMSDSSTADKVEPTFPPSIAESRLLQEILQNKEQEAWIANTLRIEWIAHPKIREIVSYFLTAYATGTWSGSNDLLSDTTDPEIGRLVTEAIVNTDHIARFHIMSPATKPERAERQQREAAQARQLRPHQVISAVRADFLSRRLADISRESEMPGLDETSKAKLLAEQFDLLRLRKTPLPPPM
ncbi:MAG: DNA primase [Limisphaerales bacterium]